MVPPAGQLPAASIQVSAIAIRRAIDRNRRNTAIQFLLMKQAKRGFAAGAVLFDLGGNGAFWKKRV